MAVSLYITITENSWSAATNKSNVTCTAVAKWTAGSYNLTQKPGKLTIDGTPYNFTSSFNDNRTTSGTKVLFRKTLDIAHDDQGKKKLTVSASYETGVSSGNIAASASKDLKDIPLASTVAATDANIGAVSMIAVTRRSTDYRHSVAWAFGELSGFLNADGTIAETEVVFTETNVPFSIPTDFYAQIPDSKTGECRLTVKTYSGDIQVGSAQTGTFTVTASESACRPYVYGSIADINDATVALTGDDTVMVRYHSDAQCSIATIVHGSASIVERRIGGVVVQEKTRTISGIETDSVEFRATDSRGYAASETETFTLIPYVHLTNNPAASRVSPSTGVSVLTVKGNYFNGSFGVAENALTVRYSVDGGDYVDVAPKLKGNTYTATVDIPDLDYRTSHTMEVVVSDALEVVQKTVNIGKSIPLFNWGEDYFRLNVNLIAPGFIQSGVVIIPPTANTPTTADVAFDAAFPDAPLVLLTPVSAVPGTQIQGVSVQNVTKDGFQAVLTRVNTIKTHIQWIAVYQP